MATKNLFCQHTAGATVYASIWNVSGSVLDFNDNTFKALGSATTPFLSLTERTGPGGSAKSFYCGTLDLALVMSKATFTPIAISYLIQAGGSPAPSTDTVVGEPELYDVRFSKVAPQVRCEFEISVKSTAGTTAQLTAWLEADGEKVDLDGLDVAPTLSVVVREHGAAGNLFTKTGAVADLKNDRFEVEQASPAFTDDRQYAAEVTITVNSVAFVTSHVFSVQGA